MLVEWALSILVPILKGGMKNCICYKAKTFFEDGINVPEVLEVFVE